jgi:hypothetical protein
MTIANSYQQRSALLILLTCFSVHLLHFLLSYNHRTGHCIAVALTQMAAATSGTSAAIYHAADAMHRLAEALQGLLGMQAAAQLLQRVAAQRALVARAAGAGLVVMLMGVWGMALLRGQVWLVHQVRRRV